MSFNPCFSGTCARTKGGSRVFNSLEELFQSLFFWNLRPDSPQASRGKWARSVSILVFLELAPGQEGWSRNMMKTVCFNPCFSGTCARTQYSLSWGQARPVSILVFLELAPGQEGGEDHGGFESFNPCFSGTCARTLAGPNLLDGHARVSILVFLELAPGLFCIHVPTNWQRCFNPCFSGTCARTKYEKYSHNVAIVSILVFLELAPGLQPVACVQGSTDVSILVFLELAPGPSTQTGSFPNISCFNPCFSGTCART